MNEAAKATATPDRVSCLVATLADRKVLLPITAVAEVINTVSMPSSGNDATPLYGWINWRDQKIPLLSAEQVMGGERPQLKLENRMAVLNAVGDAAGMGFYALLLQSLPTPIQVTAETLREETGGNKKSLSLAGVAIGEETMQLPDLLALETVVAGFKP